MMSGRPTRSNSEFKDIDSFKKIAATFEKNQAEAIQNRAEEDIATIKIKQHVDKKNESSKKDHSQCYKHAKPQKKQKQYYRIEGEKEEKKQRDWKREKDKKPDQDKEETKKEEDFQRLLKTLSTTQKYKNQTSETQKQEQNNLKEEEKPSYPIQIKEDRSQQQNDPCTQKQNNKQKQVAQDGGLLRKYESARPSDKSNTPKIVPVDPYFKHKSQYKVKTDLSTSFSTMLTYSDLPKNINKFYLSQILYKIADSNHYIVLSRYGRNGTEGTMDIWGPKTFKQCLKRHTDKVIDKLNKGYRALERNLEAKKSQPITKKPLAVRKQRSQIPSSLPSRLQRIISLIFDMKMMQSQLKDFKYDSGKLPITNLPKATIFRGYQALKNIMDEIKGQKRQEILTSLSSKFYSLIPHDFGWEKMGKYMLNSDQKVKQKLEMLQSLLDIKILEKIFSENSEGTEEIQINPLDQNYLKLGITITPIDKETHIYKMILKYVQNTHGSTHADFSLRVEDVFCLRNEEEEKNFRDDISNKCLLWHGSRLSNYVSILKQGLKIAPPQAPVTGYMFGKGVYFADMVSKAAKYCCATKQQPLACLLLCQVALGESNELFYANYHANLLPFGKLSTKGVGRSAPASGDTLQDIFVPNGLPVPTGITNTSLHYNEYIVYDINQIKCKYLLLVRFLFK